MEIGGDLPDGDANGQIDFQVDERVDGQHDPIANQPVSISDHDADGRPDFLDNNNGPIQINAPGTSTPGSMMLLDDSGVAAPPLVQITADDTASPATESITTGLGGNAGGCALTDSRSPFDPLLPGLLALAGVLLLRSKRVLGKKVRRTI